MQKFSSLSTVSMVIETKVVIGWFKLQLKILLVDLNYNFECDWFVELSDNKLSDNNLASELEENRSFFKPIATEEIVIFIINNITLIKQAFSWANWSFSISPWVHTLMTAKLCYLTFRDCGKKKMASVLIF